MLHQLYPYEFVDSVFTIDYEALKKQGFKAVIFDIDSTLVPHGRPSTPAIDELFQMIHQLGLKTFLLSNNSSERIEQFIRNIDTEFISIANKPNKDAYLQAVERLGVKKEEVVFVGDQLFTDILGANRAQMANILVKFLLQEGESKIGKKRKVEQFILKTYRWRKKYQHRLGNIEKKGEKN
ncbi:YqeG family HAD IIIA-type phosphatase [Streptococcus himalayensis]|uniref:Haloacid dehalogenase n=1 Tax=Streptococcus himalayensis TaxID=1888195 RepID=A0A917AAY0_9STRE|nr:YqeG family HAD IIIA-type phosphatase [Streptococcus himalayensis]GGE38084.1 haloacid dehalogenase [Streptococcus himalayensis]